VKRGRSKKFDQSSTIIENVERILVRIKEDPDRSTIIAFVEQSQDLGR